MSAPYTLCSIPRLAAMGAILLFAPQSFAQSNTPIAPQGAAQEAPVQMVAPTSDAPKPRKWGHEFGFELMAGISSRSIATLQTFGPYVSPHFGIRLGHDDENVSLMIGGSYAFGDTTRGLHTSVAHIGPRLGINFGILGLTFGIAGARVAIQRATTGETISDTGLAGNVGVRLNVLRWGEHDQGGLFIGINGDLILGSLLSPSGNAVLGVAF